MSEQFPFFFCVRPTYTSCGSNHAKKKGSFFFQKIKTFVHGTEDNGTFVNYASFQNKNKGMPERLFFCNKPIVKTIGVRTSNVTLDVW